MSEFNRCADLTKGPEFEIGVNKYNELLASGQDPFEYMLGMQRDLQLALHKRLPNQVMNVEKLDNVLDKYRWVQDNKVAADDEFTELVDAMPGMNGMEAKDRSAIFKKWKGKYTEVRAMKFSELSSDDIAEAYMETTDILHFILNFMFAADVNFSTFNSYYNRNSIEIFEEIKERYKELDTDILGNKYDNVKHSHNIITKLLNDSLILTNGELTLDEKVFSINVLEIFKEFIKVFYFVGLTPEQIFCYYYLKNAENHNRAKNGY